jgi:hypothetical protein
MRLAGTLTSQIIEAAIKIFFGNEMEQNLSAGFRQPFDFCQPPPYSDNRFGR